MGERLKLPAFPMQRIFSLADVRLRAADLDNNGAIDLLLGRVTSAGRQRLSGRAGVAWR